MIKLENYEVYETDLRRRLTLPKHYLSKWDYYERNATNLEDWDLKDARTLYKTLGHLTEEERVFLAGKYRVSYKKESENEPNYKLDRIIAGERGMTKREYRELRAGIELKFFHYLQRYVDKKIIF